MPTARKLRLLALVVLLAGGCGQARYVMKDQWGGVVAIPNNSNRWPAYNRKHAEELMAQQFPQGYVIEGENEVVVGQQSQVHTTADPFMLSPFGGETQMVSRRNLTEWHIRFRAKDAPKNLAPLALVPNGQPPAASTKPPPAPIALTSGTSLPPEPVPVAADK